MTKQDNYEFQRISIYEDAERRLPTMKRVLTFILMLALFAITPPIVLANAEEVVAEEKQEILFQGIPWDSDANTV